MVKTMLSLLLISCSFLSFGTDYFFSTSGKNTNEGTSIDAPFQTLNKLKSLSLKAGDCIYLKKGGTFYGTIELVDLSGKESSPIQVKSYGDANFKPIIDAKGEMNGILIQDCSHITISDIEITADGGGIKKENPNGKYMRCGVFLTAKKEGTYNGITIDNVHVHDVFFEEPGIDRGAGEILTGNGNQNYGWGIRTINSNKKAILKNIVIKNCLVENVAHSGIRFTGKHGLSTSDFKNIQDVKVLNNKVLYVGGPAMQSSVVDNIEFYGNVTDHSGSLNDSRKWGRGSGLWVWGCNKAMIQHNTFRCANGPGDSAGCHIDFNNKDVIIQYNLSENNVGGFVEILGNNQNCTYRYNVSVNDGSRRKIASKTLGAGTMIGINGFVGMGKKPIGARNIYIYNNTIYVKESMTPEVGVASHTSGVLIANNIFYIEGKASYDHRKPFLPKNGTVNDVVFKNNVYLKRDCWPNANQVTVVDSKPLYGNPEFSNTGGYAVHDYVPNNAALIKNKGIEIELIPNDEKGLWGGFKPQYDILGNEIKGKPDLGAVEMR